MSGSRPCRARRHEETTLHQPHPQPALHHHVSPTGLDSESPFFQAALAEVTAAELERRNAEAADRVHLIRVFNAIMVSPRIEICEALLKGQRVNRLLLDQDWLARIEKT